jgi:hypothetical protein
VTTEAPRADPNPTTNLLWGSAGALAGGVIGYFAFLWVVKQGFYAGALPGALLGLGCGLLIRRRSIFLAGVCGVFSLLLGLVAEWRVFPFAADDSFGYFLAHLHQLRSATLLLILLGGVFGCYFALGIKRKAA